MAPIEFIILISQLYSKHPFAILAMTSRDRGDEPFVPTWDGEVHSWPEYSRRVRLCWAQTPEYKRYTLGPKLVLRLRGKAWDTAASIDHTKLSQTSGTAYLLKFLKDKLGRLPVPDIGQHLDELFVRLRRSRAPIFSIGAHS